MKLKHLIFLVASSLAVIHGIAAAEPLPETVDGILTIVPAQDRSCLSVRVNVGSGAAVSGMRWYNGSGDPAFVKILAAAGGDSMPPLYEDYTMMMEPGVQSRDGWTQVVFRSP